MAAPDEITTLNVAEAVCGLVLPSVNVAVNVYVPIAVDGGDVITAAIVTAL